MNKTKKKIKFNQGNSFIVVIATISFLAVLVTALLVAVALCYRLKAYDINSRDNFYYLEKAMDEIYENVGNKTMQHLNDAYNETLGVLVYFDPEKESYVTMSDKDANIMMRKSFVNRLQTDAFFTDSDVAEQDLIDYISTKGTSVDTDTGITLTLGNITKDDQGAVTFNDIVITRSATYSTINTIDASNANASTNTYVQSITTDLVVAPPEYDVDFTNVGRDVDDLYDFVMISDMGVEIAGIGTKSHITGNVYAAADFYNKVYNNVETTKVNSYDADKLATCDGVSETSMFSGFYVNSADVSVVAEKMIVPGSIAAMNCAELSIVGSADATGADYAQVWADGIALDGYSRKLSSNADAYSGSVIDMKADAYIYDDLEVNATGSKFALNGNYYGYNYASIDNRTYSDEFIAASTNRKYLDSVKIYDGNYISDKGEGGALKSQAHYNSSAIIVNGADSTLDLSETEKIYIAGQAYVELSKSVESKEYDVDNDDDDDTSNQVMGDTYSYADPDDQTNSYTTNKSDTYNNEHNDAIESLQDYRTGEAISVKSNQLAYIPPYRVKETEDGDLYVAWPEILDDTEFETIFADMSKVPVIKTVVSGKVNYFYDFTNATITINEYLEKYADLFDEVQGQPRSTGTMADFYDITDYQLFKVDNVILDGDANPNNQNNLDDIKGKIYSNSAISYKNGNKINIIAKSNAVDVLTTAATALENMNNADVPADVRNVTLGINDEYKEMKMLLTSKSTNGDKVTEAHGKPESEITPINEYFDLAELADIRQTMTSGYEIFMNNGNDEDDGDVEVTGNGKVKGIVVCTGDVTFDDKVTEFEGIIVAGGKIKVDHSINFVANAEVVKSILRECYDVNNSVALEERTEATDWQAKVCRLFKNFAASYNTASGNEAEKVDSMRNVAMVVYEDMLSFENWKKNVD